MRNKWKNRQIRIATSINKDKYKKEYIKVDINKIYSDF